MLDQIQRLAHARLSTVALSYTAVPKRPLKLSYMATCTNSLPASSWEGGYKAGTESGHHQVLTAQHKVCAE